MTGAGAHHEAVVSLCRRIVEAEMRSTAAADALAALIRTDADTTEGERRFAEEMTVLLVMRRQLLELQSSEGA